MNTRGKWAGALFASTLTFCVHAAAETITFDHGDLGPLTYNTFAVISDTCCGVSGYANANVSPDEEIFNGRGYPSSFSYASAFTLTSFYLGAAWSDGLNVSVIGRLAGVQIYSTVLTVSTSGPTLETLNWSGIDEADFNSYGGVDHGFFNGSGNQFVMDNLTVDGVVPEPEAWALVLGGSGLAGAALRRRRGLSATA